MLDLCESENAVREASRSKCTSRAIRKRNDGALISEVWQRGSHFVSATALLQYMFFAWFDSMLACGRWIFASRNLRWEIELRNLQMWIVHGQNFCVLVLLWLERSTRCIATGRVGSHGSWSKEWRIHVVVEIHRQHHCNTWSLTSSIAIVLKGATSQTGDKYFIEKLLC